MSRRISTFFGLFLIFSLIFSYTKFVFAATRTWDGGGATNNWSECANWSSDTCPIAGDVATFNATSTKNATIDSAFISSIGRMNMNAGYTGIITQARSFTFTSSATTIIASGTFSGNTDDLTFSGPFSISGGTFTAGSQTVTHTGQITISGGTYNASPLTTYFTSTYNHTGSGTFNHNSGSVIFNGSLGASLLLNVTETFNNVEMNKTGSGYVTTSSNDTVVITGTLTLTDGYFSCSGNSGTLEAQGPISVGVAWEIDPAFVAAAATNTPPCGGIIINGTNTQTLSVAGDTLGFIQVLTLNNANFTLDSSGSGLFTMRYLTLQAGTVDATGFDVSISKFSQTGGTFISGSGTDSIGWNVDYAASNFSLTGGTFTATSGTLTVNSNFTHTGGTFTHNNGTVILDPPNGLDVTMYGSTTFYNLSVSVTSSDPTAVLGTWTLPAGETQTIQGTLTASGSLSGIFSHRLEIRSSSTGSQASIDPQGARVLSWLDVMDNNNINALAIPCFEGFVDSGNLTNWDSCITITESGGSTNVTEGGATDTYTVVLDYLPTATVTVTITPNAQVTTNVPTLTFTTGNWNVPQTVTVTAVDDTDIEGTHVGNIAHTSSSTDPDYDGISVASVAPAITDNDSAGITVGSISDNTTEAGGAATFTVVLDSLPTGDVTIPLSSSDLTEGTVSPASLTFTTLNWSTPQTVTVTGVDDLLADGNIVYSIVAAAATSTDGGYSGLNAADVSVTNVDDDAVGITVGVISGDTTEAGGTATFTVVLNLLPTADVTVGLTSSDTTEGTVSASSLTFTTANWDTPQTVIATGVNDDLDDGDIVYSIVTAAATSADGGYNGINPADVSVTNIDNDSVGITVGTISGDTTEATGTAAFTIVLTSQPTADVTVGLSSSDTTEGTVGVSSVVFTSGNWSTPQTVTVTGVNDDIDDGDITYSIVTASATSADGAYNGIDPSNVSVINIDDDVIGITIGSISADTTEVGGTATFTVVLLSQPTADVSTAVSSSDTTEDTVSTSSLTFTSGNWNTPQTITVTGVNDDIADGNIVSSIVLATLTSVDSAYSGIDPSDVSVTNLDDDVVDITISSISGNTTEAGGTATFTIVLTSQPTADVTIGLTSSDTSEGTIAVSSVVFTSVNWSTPQAVTVTGINDADDDGDITYAIVTAAATSADSGYSGTNPADVSVINTDDDTTAESSDAGGGSAPMPSTGTITVTKVVVNDNGKTKGVDDFRLFMNDSVIVSGETYRVSAAPTLYTITETADSDYIGTFSGDCDAAGVLELSSGQNASCTITNDDIAESTPVTGAPSTPVSDPSSGVFYPIPPVIDVEKTPSVTVLPDGPAPVTYVFTLRNIGTIPVADVSMVDDTCTDVVFTSGDDNNDGILDIGEIWNYRCSTTLFTTSTGVVTATGWANGIQAVDTASSTLVVKESIFIPTFPNTGVASHSSPTSWMEFMSKTLGISLFCISVVFCIGTLRIVKNA